MSLLPPSKVMQLFLIDQGYGNLPPNTVWPIYFGFMPGVPQAPADAIAVYDTVGLKDGRLINTGEVIEYPGIQIRVRATAYENGFDRIQRITNKLDTVLKHLIIIGNDAYTIHNITRLGPPISLGQEEGSTRVLFVVNTRMTLFGGPPDA